MNFKWILIGIYLIVIFNSGCKKEAQDQTSPTPVSTEWKRISSSRNYQNAFEKDGEVYLIGLDSNFKMNSSESIEPISSMNTKTEGISYLYRSRFSGKYVAQLNLNRWSMSVYELLNPQVNTTIYFDSLPYFPGSLSVWGMFNNNDEFMISTQNSTAVKFTFETIGNAIHYSTTGIVFDSLNPISNSLQRILSSGSDFYISTRHNLTYKYSSGGVTELNGISMWDIFSLNDTLYSPIFWNGVYGDGLLSSVNDGQSWYMVVSGLRMDYYFYNIVEGKILMTFRGELRQLKMDHSANQWIFHPLNTDGLEDKLNLIDDDIVKVFYYEGKIYAATTKGLFVRKPEELDFL